jgi:rare lipoprotein A
MASSLLLSACGMLDRRSEPARTTATTATAVIPAPTLATPQKPPTAAKRGGGYYQDDGPGESAPEDLDAIPDAVPRDEPLHRFANNPYNVFGKDYTPRKTLGGYRARGVASWYGKKFHGQKTSSGEIYDMFGMTAAHPTLPIPSYVRVTNPSNEKSVVLRINDRGPFHAGRLIDLSWTAAAKLGYIGSGSTLVEVESIVPGQDTQLASAKSGGQSRPLLAKAPPQEDPVARIAEATTPKPTPLAAVQESSGHYLQLGAFGSRDNAEALQSRLSRELGQLGERLTIRSSGSLFRVQLGPWEDLAAARQVAEQLRKTLDIMPVVVPR